MIILLNATVALPYPVIMNVLIIEDEATAARRLQRQLAEVAPTAEVLAVLDSVEASRAWLAMHPQPDLLLMDIHLGDGTSFDLLAEQAITAPIIFTTAYDEYAMRAFQAHSVAYLLKPIKAEDLAAALDKLQQLQRGGPNLDVAALARQVQQQEPMSYQRRLILRLPDQLKVIAVEEAAYFYIEARLTFIRLFDGRSYPLDFTLDQLEERLDPAQFFRLNRQVIVTFEAIDKIHTYPKSRLKLALKPPLDQEVMVSSERSAAFKAWLQH